MQSPVPVYRQVSHSSCSSGGSDLLRAVCTAQSAGAAHLGRLNLLASTAAGVRGFLLPAEKRVHEVLNAFGAGRALCHKADTKSGATCDAYLQLYKVQLLRAAALPRYPQ